MPGPAQRRPLFAQAAAALGVRSMLAFQLSITETTMGAVNLHSSHLGAFDDRSPSCSA
ncbi:hypothetical protein [Rhodococcus sp. NPDC057529]|uniref:hypothetical protein n=1 Tax=Rhodococcus sp. NPDC057529 TaxID=3346158 RepID=UPI00366A8E72